MPRPKKSGSPFRYFNSWPEVIRLVVMMFVRFPLSLRNVEDLLVERGIDIFHETVGEFNRMSASKGVPPKVRASATGSKADIQLTMFNCPLYPESGHWLDSRILAEIKF